MSQPAAATPQTLLRGNPAAAGALHHPAWNEPARFESFAQPAGDDEATALTVHHMGRLASEDAQAPMIQAAAEIATRGTRNAQEKAAGIFAWVKRRVQFKEDAENAALAGLPDAQETELLIRPVDLLRMRTPAGDCDDFATLTAALLMAAGIPADFCTIAADASSPEQYSHVYTRALLPAGPLPMDTSHGPAPGWEAPAVGKTKTWSIPTMPAPAAHLGAIDWNSIIQTGVKAGTEIATARYGQPPAGTYRQGADGSVFFRQDPNTANPLTFPGVGVNVGGGSTGTLLVFGAVAVVLVLLLSRK